MIISVKICVDMFSFFFDIYLGMELLDHMVNEVQLHKKVELFSESEPTVLLSLSSVQSFSHVRLCDPMDCSMPGLPVHHQLPEFIQTHVH